MNTKRNVYPRPKGSLHDNDMGVHILVKCPYCEQTHVHKHIGLRNTPCGNKYLILANNLTLYIKENEYILTKTIIQNRLEAI